MSEFQWHPDVAEHLAKLRIEAICLIDGELHREGLFPATGKWETSEGQCDVLVSKHISPVVKGGLLGVRLYATAFENDPVLRFKLVYSNSTSAPPGPIEGRFGVLVHGIEPIIDSAPRFQLAQAVEFGDGVLTDAMVMGDKSIGDQQEAGFEFLVGFGGRDLDGDSVTAKERVYDEVLYPGRPIAIGIEPLMEPIVERPLLGSLSEEFYRLLTTPRDPGYNFGFRKGANWSGPDRRFGVHPEPNLIYCMHPEAAAIASCELLRTHTRYPDHCGIDEGYLDVPNPRAIYYDGSLSEHSRNRLGRPERPVPAEWNGLRDDWEAPRAEWVASVVPKLAWYANDFWAKRECVKLGYKQMNTMHKPIPIREGGYDCVYLRIMRALWRGVRLLWECARVCEKAGWSTHAERFYDHVSHVFMWVTEEWKPENYGLTPRNSSEEVPGYEDEKVIPAWQIMHIPVAYYAWKDLGSSYAMEVLRDLSRVLLASYVKQEDGSFLQRKIVLADDPTIGWEPSLLDGLDLWPTSGLKLISQKGQEFDMDTHEILKAHDIHTHHCKRDPGLAGGPWVPLVSEWGCGDFA